MDDKKKDDVVVPPVDPVIPETPVEDPELVKIREERDKLKEERDNYKQVALKRLGKLPGDAEFLDGEGKSLLTVEEQVKAILLDKEDKKLKDAEAARTVAMAREISELKIALKNRPGASLGGDSGASADVKDNILTVDQTEALKRRALQLGLDPVKFVENAKKNLSKRT